MKKRLFVITILTLFFDQIIKHLVMINFSYQVSKTIIPNLLYFTYVKNTGGAWSIFSNNPYLLVLIGVVCLGILFYYLSKKTEFNHLESIYLGLITGGIIGNFIDRVFRGGVIDYIGIILKEYYFPVFNLADMAIVLGACLLVYDSIRRP